MISLAWLEIQVTLANFFNRLDMSLYQTNEYTTEWRDNGNAMLRDSVKVKVEALKK